MAKDKTTKLLDLIAKAESSPAGGYEAVVGSKTGIKGLKNKTIKEVLEIQKQRLKEGKNTAIGRYQIINKTLKEAIKKTGISEDSLFNEETQDKLGKSLLEKRGLSKYLSGKIDSVKFGNNLAKEWAGLPILTNIKNKKRGQSYYKGVGDNKAIISPEELEKILNSNEEPMAKENKKSLLGPLKSLQYENEEGIDMVMQGIQPEAREQLQMNIEKESTMANVQKDPKQEVSKMIQEQKASRQPASEDVVIQPQETMEQTRESLDQGFKDALMYFGPRLGAMILGGTEAAEITDRVMTGFERFKTQRAAQTQQEGVATRKEQREEERLKLSKANLQARLAELRQAGARTENLQTERAFRKAEISTKKAIDAFDKFGKRADVKEYIKKQSTYNNLGTLLTEGKKIPDLSLSLIAKSIGGETGVLTDRDIARAQVNPDIISSLKRGVYRKAKGEIPPEDAKEIMKIVEALKEKEAILMKDRTQKYVNTRKRFLSGEDASLLNRDLLEGVLGITADQQEDTGLTPEEEQELKELEEKEAQGLL